MKLYHGSTVLVTTPEIRTGAFFLDFGVGFYTTTSFEQAERWAKIKMRREQSAIGPVADDNVYQSIRFFETGVLNAEETVKRLKTEVLHDQWTFHTPKALSYCRFIDYKEVR